MDAVPGVLASKNQHLKLRIEAEFVGNGGSNDTASNNGYSRQLGTLLKRWHQIQEAVEVVQGIAVLLTGNYLLALLSCLI